MNSKSKTALSTMVELMELFRQEVDPVMPIQTAVVFLQTALRKQTTMRELGEITGLSQASMSRNIAALSKHHRLGKQGHDLVVTREDPAERRVKIVELTKKGQKLVDKLTKLVEKRC